MGEFEAAARKYCDAGQWKELVQHYLDGWKNLEFLGDMPSEQILCALWRPEAAALLLHGDGSPVLAPESSQELRASLSKCFAGMVSHNVRLQIARAYLPDRFTPDGLMLSIRDALNAGPAEEAMELARWSANEVVSRKGVTAGREFLFRLIHEIDSEDVHRGAISAAVKHDLLTSADAFRLPPRVREYWLGRMAPHRRAQHGPTDFIRDVMPGLSTETGEALLGLLNPTSVKLGASRADFSREEWAGICDHHAWAAPEWLLDITGRILGVSPLFLVERLANVLPRSVIGVPMGFIFSPLRLLHTKAILASPTMSGPVRDHETPLVVEVSQVITSDAVVIFDGSMHFSNRSIRASVRRRYAEAVGEAMGVMFLEDAIGLDLSTLVRIEESSRVQSPDFRAKARNGRVVIETKGASTWDYFSSSLAKAMRQIGKSGPKRPLLSKDRAFVCRTFVAQRDDERGSLLAVDDPPVDVGTFFGEREDDTALRKHFAGVCTLAGYSDVARELTGVPPVRGERETRSERARRESVLEVGGTAYVGVSHGLDEIADLYGVELPRWCGPLRVFRGIERKLLGDLRRGRVRARGFPARRFLVREPTEREHGPSSGVGVLNANERQGAGFGVYSVLADGSMLAITG